MTLLHVTELSVKSLSVRLGGKSVLTNMSFESRGGEFIGLVGPNGAGKTTLLRAILGLVASDGDVLLDGHDLRRLSVFKRRRNLPISRRNVTLHGRFRSKCLFLWDARLSSQSLRA